MPRLGKTVGPDTVLTAPLASNAIRTVCYVNDAHLDLVRAVLFFIGRLYSRALCRTIVRYITVATVPVHR